MVYVEKEVRIRDFDSGELEKIVYENKNDEMQNMKYTMLKENYNEIAKTIKYSSKYKNYFEKYLKGLNTQIEGSNEQTMLNSNYFYSPELFKIIEKYLYLVPLWSGLLIYDQNLKKCRLSNNPVENWFGHLKNNMLNREKVMPSKFVGILYKKILSKYLLYYNENQLTIVNPVKTKFSFEEEKWRKNEPKKKRQKGFYFQSIKNLGFGNESKTIQGI